MKIRQKEAADIKIIVCDLDGTLLNHHKKITSATAEYLIRLQRAGYLLVLASGRFYYELTPFIQQLQMKRFHGFAVCANGLEIHDIAKENMHRFDHLSSKEVQDILALCKQHHITAYANDHQSYQAVCNPWIYLSIKTARLLCRPFAHVSLYPMRLLYQTDFQKQGSASSWKQLDKICFLSSHHKLKAFQKEVLTRYPDRYRFYFVDRFAMEIVKHNVSKCNALAYICKQMGYTMQNILAFGDSGNDEELLSCAGIGITMKNGFYQTRKKARILSQRTNNQEGVLDMLKRLPLLR